MIEVGAVKPRSAYEWNRLVEQSQHADFYHLWEWGKALFSTYGYRRYYLAAKQDGDLLGALPLIYVRSILFGNRLISVPLCEYGGPLVHRTLTGEEKEQVIGRLLSVAGRLATALGAEYVELRGLSSEVINNVVRTPGYASFRKYVTFLIDLAKPVEVLWGNLDKKTRNATRKAMKKGVEVVKAETIEQLEAYYRLYLETQKRHGSPPHTFKLFKNFFEIFHTKGLMKTSLAMYEGKPIAGNLTFHWNDIIYWSSNVADIKHRGLNPTNLLLWKTIECGSDEGNRLFDLGRTRSDTTIHHFKKGWGGREAKLNNHILFCRDAKTPPDPSQRRFAFLSRFWSLIPVSASRRLGSYIIKGLAP